MEWIEGLNGGIQRDVDDHGAFCRHKMGCSQQRFEQQGQDVPNYDKATAKHSIAPFVRHESPTSKQGPEFSLV